MSEKKPTYSATNKNNNHNHNNTKSNSDSVYDVAESKIKKSMADSIYSNIIEQLHMYHILTLAYLLSKGARHNYIDITTAELGNNIKKSQQSASRYLTDLEQNGLIERVASTFGRSMSVRVTEHGLDSIKSITDILQRSVSFADSDNFTPVSLSGVLMSGMGEGAYYMALDGYTEQFRSKIGYVPFPGTLNVQLQRREYKEIVRRLKSERTGIMIKSFSDGQRTYGWAKCFPAILRVNDFAQVRQPQPLQQPSQPSQQPQTQLKEHSITKRMSDGEEREIYNSNNIEHQNHINNPNIKTDFMSKNDTGILCALIVLERTHHNDSIIELISNVCLREAASISDGSAVDIDIIPVDCYK